MPFLADEELVQLEDLVQSDLLNTVESPRESAPRSAVKPTNDLAVGASVVAIEDEGVNSSDDDADIAATMPPSAAKKRGRPSLSRSETPAKPSVAKTPRSTKTPHSAKTAPTPKSTGRKRKAPEPEPEQEEEEAEEGSTEAAEPAKKRGRPSARAAAVATSARLAAKAANKPARGRPKGSASTTKTAADKPAKGKGGRPKKGDTNGGSTSAEEFEVEEIVESAVDADTKELMYFVKWKGYPVSDNTWEPKKNLAHAAELLKAFDAKKKAAIAERKAEEKAEKQKKAEERAAAKEKKQQEKKPAKAVEKKKAKTEKVKELPKRGTARTTRSTRSG
ncbi:hypothetical protein V8F20_008025 [Naviculisporaceae sp. PSN 640]